jgi:hypothetical protein
MAKLHLVEATEAPLAPLKDLNQRIPNQLVLDSLSPKMAYQQ